MIARHSRAITVRFGLGGRLGLVLLLLLVWAAPAAAISPVTSGSAPGTGIGATVGNSTVTVTPTAATGDNNTVVVIVATKNTSTGMATPAVQDSGGSVYNLRADVTANSTSSRVRVYSTNPGASKTSTWVQAKVACCSFPTDIVVAVASYSGVFSLGPTTTGTVNMSNTTAAQVSLTIQEANNWVVAGFAASCAPSCSTDVTATSGSIEQNAVANATIRGVLMDNTSAIDGTAVNNTLLLTSASNQWTAMAALELRTVQGFSAAEGHLCGISDKNSSSSWTFTAGFGNPLEAGHLGVLTLATDNRATSNGNTNDHQSITDAAGNTWTKAREFTNAQGAAGAGVTVSIWYTKASSTLASGANITVNFSGAITAKAVSCEEFTMGDSLTVEAGGDVAATNTTIPGSITLSGLSNTSHLWIRATGREFPPGVWTGSGANFTQFWGTGTSGGSNITNVDIRSEALIAAGTSLTTNPSAGTTTDWASTMVALSAVCNPVNDASYVAANAQNGQITVYWPAGTKVVILQKANNAFLSEKPSSPGTATQVYSGSAGTVTLTSADGIANGTPYYHKVFVSASGCYSSGVAVNLTPQAGTSQPWSYTVAGGSTLAASIAGYGTLYTSSNAGRIISLNTADGTQSWAAGPTATNANTTVQSWLSWIPISGSANNAVIGGDLGTGGANSATVYFVDVSSGAKTWTKSSLTGNGADAIVAAVSAQLWAYSNSAFQSTLQSTYSYSGDVVYVVTRNTSRTGNTVYALKATDGGVLWNFNPSTTYTVDQMFGQPYVDYGRNLVYVASKAGTANNQSNLWIIDSATGTVVKQMALGTNHIQTSPTLSYWGTTLYVADVTGNLYAIDLTACRTTDASCNATLKWSAPAALGSAIKDTAFVWEDYATPGRLYFSTKDGNVWCWKDPGAGATPIVTTPCSGWSVVKTPVGTAVNPPGTPLLLNYLFVGGWNSTLSLWQIYQLNPSTGAIVTQVTVGDGTKQLGDLSTETGNEIFVGTSDGKIFKYNLTGGSL